MKQLSNGDMVWYFVYYSNKHLKPIEGYQKASHFTHHLHTSSCMSIFMHIPKVAAVLERPWSGSRVDVLQRMDSHYTCSASDLLHLPMSCFFRDGKRTPHTPKGLDDWSMNIKRWNKISTELMLKGCSRSVRGIRTSRNLVLIPFPKQLLDFHS